MAALACVNAKAIVSRLTISIASVPYVLRRRALTASSRPGRNPPIYLSLRTQPTNTFKRTPRLVPLALAIPSRILAFAEGGSWNVDMCDGSERYDTLRRCVLLPTMQESKRCCWIRKVKLSMGKRLLIWGLCLPCLRLYQTHEVRLC